MPPRKLNLFSPESEDFLFPKGKFVAEIEADCFFISGGRRRMREDRTIYISEKGCLRRLGIAESITLKRDYCANPRIVIECVHEPSGHGLGDLLAIDRVIFNDPATIVLWKDGTKTVVKCQEGDTYSEETGLALCVMKKVYGNKGRFNDLFKKWIPEEAENEQSEPEICEKISNNEVKDPLKGFDVKRGRGKDVDVGKIKALHKAHWTAEQIADDMGISVPTVYKYLRKLRESGEL